MRALLEGRIVKIHRAEFKSKAGEEWERATIQMMTDYPGQLIEVENIDIMERKGQLKLDPMVESAYKNKTEIALLVNVTLAKIKEGVQEMRTRILQAEPLRGQALSHRLESDAIGNGVVGEGRGGNLPDMNSPEAIALKNKVAAAGK